MTTSHDRAAVRGPAPMSGAYRAVWRWHFYAGLLVMPVLMLMALTGGVYLFHAEIDDALHRSMAEVRPSANIASPDRWMASARVAGAGDVVSVLRPAQADRAVRATVRQADGAEVWVFVDPGTARATGVVTAGGVGETVKRLHSLDIVGAWGNRLVEIVAGWAMILVATGVFLWWPRRREAGVVTVRARSGRPFWRDLHAVTGLYAGAVIVFLAFTGMPWSGVWGGAVLGMMRDSGIGRPPPPAAVAPAWEHAEHGEAPQGVGWTLQGAALPAASPGAPSLARVVAAADAARLARPYLVSVPATPGRAWTVAHEARQVENTRTLYVEAGTGRVVADIGYGQFGWGARAFEWGVAAHQGTQYGEINRWVMLSGCVAVWLLSVSGLVMWWRRRPKGRLAAPVAPPGPCVRAAVLGIVLPLCVLFPLTGLSLAVALLFDRAATAIGRRAVTS